MNKRSGSQFTIFDYTEYRLLLKEYYLFQKQKIRSFSYRYFAGKTGVSSSVLKDIIEGRCKLTLAVMRKYDAAMQLIPRKIEYFSTVVQFVNS